MAQLALRVIAPGVKFAKCGESHEMMKAGCDRLNLGAEEGDNGLRAISVVLINVRVVKIKLDTAKILFDELGRCITVFLSTDAEAKLSKSSRAPCID